MPAQNIDVFMPVVIMLVLAIVIFAGALLVSSIISPHHDTQLKSQPYECGEDPIGSAWSAFNVRFYVVGLIFIIFDVESVLMFPVAAIFKQMNDLGHGSYVLLIFLSFISILIEGIAYCWKKGDLDWVKSFQSFKR